MTATPWYADAPLSMAHLCELDTPPAELISIAAKAGLASVGFRTNPAAAGGIEYPLQSAAEQTEVRRRVAETGVQVLYVELISISEATVAADHERMLETGAAIGATRVCVGGDSANLDVVAEKLGQICDIAGPLGLAIDLEFMPFRGVRSLFANRSLVMLSASSAFRTMTVNSLLTFLPVYLANELGYPAVLVGACMFGLQAAGFVASPIAGHLSDRLGPRGVMTGAMVASALLLVAMALAGGSTAFMVLIAVLGFFLYASRPVIQAWLLDCTPKDLGGTSIGVLFGAQAIGSSVAPFACGAIADRYGILATFYFLAATIVIGNLLLAGVPARGASR